jgi:hypothetical protein
VGLDSSSHRAFSNISTLKLKQDNKGARLRDLLLSSTSKSQPLAYLLDGTPARQAPISQRFNRSQFQLGNTIDNLFLHHPTACIMFVTLTFADRLRSTSEAHRRLNSWLNHIRARYSGYLWVLQPHGSGAIHYHLLVPVTFDTHVGTDLDLWAHRNLYSDSQRRQFMNQHLGAESDWWQSKAPAFGFGRIEVAPIYGNAEGIRRYLTRQDWRQWHWPFDETKCVRFWCCSKSLKAGTSKFSWNSPRGQVFRARLQDWAADYGASSFSELNDIVGRSWGYRFICHLRELETAVQ